METIVNNPGLHIVFDNITSYLDYQSIKNCLEVSKSFKEYLESQEKIWLKQIRLFKHERFFKKKFYYGYLSYGFFYWLELLQSLEKCSDLDKIQTFVHIMHEFLHWYNNTENLGSDPFHPFVFFAENEEFFKNQFLFECMADFDANFAFSGLRIFSIL